MTSFTGIFGTALGDILNEAVGMEPTDAEFDARCDASFARFDADGSGTLHFDETLEAFRTFPVRRSDEDVRATFDRFDADGSGALDVHEFRALMRALRSSARLDRMPGVIYCGGELVNPTVNPKIANEIRLRKLYAEPYVPKSALAKAIAKPTVRRQTVYGGIDLLELSMLTDSDEEPAQTDADPARRDAHRRAPAVASAARGWGSNKPPRLAARRLAYALLLVARLVACLLPGYVHPDEYHQTVEIAASDVLGVRSAPRAWEFEPSRPARSVLGPVVAAGWTYAAARAIAAPIRTIRGWANDAPCETRLSATAAASASYGGAFDPSRANACADFSRDDSYYDAPPWVVVLAPRLGAFFLSLVVDAAASRAARAAYWAGPHPTWSGYAAAGLDARLAVASCWATLALQIRPFTNAAEATAAAAAAAIVIGRAEDTSDVVAAGVLGAITAVGAWIRFTFPLFVAPLGARLVWDAARGGRVAAALRVVLAGLFAFFAAAFALVAIDTRYFRGREGLDAAFAAPFANPTPWAVAPLNNLLYNLRAENLANHGIHPRITHAAVNAPALFGPMMIAAYLALARGVRRSGVVGSRAGSGAGSDAGSAGSEGSSSRSRATRSNRDSSFAKTDRASTARAARATLSWMVWLPLLALSTAPHQEPRFLLPLLLPLAATRHAAAVGTRARAALWCALNLAGVIVFGVAHQGGVAPALVALPTLAASNPEATRSNPAVAVFWRTYTPPESVLARRDPLRDNHLRVVDLAGAHPNVLLEALVARKTYSDGNSTDALRRDATTLLVTPATAASRAADEWRRVGADATLEMVWSWAGHFSGEETDAYVEAFEKGGWKGAWNAMSLGVYRVETKG